MLYFSVLWMLNNIVEELTSKSITRPGVTIGLHEVRLSVPWRNNIGRDLNNLPRGQRQLLLTAGDQQISTHRDQETNIIVLQFQNQHKQSNKIKNKRQLLFFLIQKTNELAK